MNEIQVVKDSGIARWYFWSLRVWKLFEIGLNIDYGFAEKMKYAEANVEKARTEGTNLCAMVRTMVFYAPLAIAAQLLFWGSLLGAFVVVPIYLFGFHAWGAVSLKISGVVLCIVVAWAVIIACAIYLDGLKYKWGRYKYYREERRKAGEVKSVSHLALEWLKAKKQKVCPFVTFTDAEAE